MHSRQTGSWHCHASNTSPPLPRPPNDVRRPTSSAAGCKSSNPLRCCCQHSLNNSHTIPVLPHSTTVKALNNASTVPIKLSTRRNGAKTAPQKRQSTSTPTLQKAIHNTANTHACQLNCLRQSQQPCLKLPLLTPGLPNRRYMYTRKAAVRRNTLLLAPPLLQSSMWANKDAQQRATEKTPLPRSEQHSKRCKRKKCKLQTTHRHTLLYKGATGWKQCCQQESHSPSHLLWSGQRCCKYSSLTPRQACTHARHANTCPQASRVTQETQTAKPGRNSAAVFCTTAAALHSLSDRRQEQSAAKCHSKIVRRSTQTAVHA